MRKLLKFIHEVFFIEKKLKNPLDFIRHVVYNQDSGKDIGTLKNDRKEEAMSISFKISRLRLEIKITFAGRRRK